MKSYCEYNNVCLEMEFGKVFGEQMFMDANFDLSIILLPLTAITFVFHFFMQAMPSCLEVQKQTV